jgi:hypothetical protein
MADPSTILARPIHQVIDDYCAAQALMWIRGDDIAIPYLVGVPGIAKTAHVIAMCKRNDWNCMHTHFSLRPIEEISGLPRFRKVNVLSNGETKEVEGTYWTLPDILSQLYDVASNGKITIWFMDDYHLASPGHMCLSYEMFSQDRQLRGYDLPKNVAFILAGNDSSMAGARQQYSAVINRIAKYPVILDFQQWKNDYAIPQSVNNRIVSFLNNLNYSRWFTGQEQVDKPWPSPRSWTRFGCLLSIIERNRAVPLDEVLFVGAAHVGDEAASDFGGYYEMYSKIDAAAVLEGRINIEIPSSMVNRYIYMMACTLEMIDRAKDKKALAKAIPILCNVFGAMCQVQSEIAVAGLKEIVLAEKAHALKGLFITVLNTLRQTQDASSVEKLTIDLQNL